MAEPKPKIYEAIIATMRDIGAVGKDAKNTFDNYAYRSIDGLMNSLHPALVKNGIFTVPTVLESTREERPGKNGTHLMYTIMKIKYTFYAEDGSFVESIVNGEAMDRSDKSTNKAMASAYKYAIFQTFCVPTAELLDSEQESLEMQPKEPEKPKKAPRRQDTPEEAKLNEEMRASVDPDLLPDPKRTPEYRAERIRARIAEKKQDEALLMQNAKVKDWRELTDAKFVSLMGWLERK